MDNGSTQMTCVLRVDTQKSGWDKSFCKLLKDIQDVTYTVDATKGLAYVSGKINPEVILKIRKAKKHTELIHMEYGYKNPNYPPENPPADPPADGICPNCSVNLVQNPYDCNYPEPQPPKGYYCQYSPYNYPTAAAYDYLYSNPPYFPTGDPATGEQQCCIL